MRQMAMDYVRVIHEKGFRITPQRQLILDAIFDGQGHSTIAEIYQRVHSKDPHVNLATVYRNLDFLCELRLLVAADMGGGRMAYEIAGETPHHHLICRTCGKIEQISQAEVRQFLAQVDGDHNFLIDMDHIALFGLCYACRK